MSKNSVFRKHTFFLIDVYRKNYLISILSSHPDDQNF